MDSYLQRHNFISQSDCKISRNCGKNLFMFISNMIENKMKIVTIAGSTYNIIDSKHEMPSSIYTESNTVPAKSLLRSPQN